MPVNLAQLLNTLADTPHAQELYEGFKFGFRIPLVPSPWIRVSYGEFKHVVELIHLMGEGALIGRYSECIQNLLSSCQFMERMCPCLVSFGRNSSNWTNVCLRVAQHLVLCLSSLLLPSIRHHIQNFFSSVAYLR